MLLNQSDNQLSINVPEQTEEKLSSNIADVLAKNNSFAINNLDIAGGGLVKGSFVFDNNIDKFSEITVIIDEKPIISIKLKSIKCKTAHNFDF